MPTLGALVPSSLHILSTTATHEITAHRCWASCPRSSQHPAGILLSAIRVTTPAPQHLKAGGSTRVWSPRVLFLKIGASAFPHNGTAVPPPTQKKNEWPTSSFTCVPKTRQDCELPAWSVTPSLCRSLSTTHQLLSIPSLQTTTRDQSLVPGAGGKQDVRHMQLVRDRNRKANWSQRASRQGEARVIVLQRGPTVEHGKEKGETHVVER